MPALAARYRLPILMTTAAFFIAAPKPAQAQVIEHAGRLADIDVFPANNNVRIGGNTQQLPISSGAGGSYLGEISLLIRSGFSLSPISGGPSPAANS